MVHGPFVRVVSLALLACVAACAALHRAAAPPAPEAAVGTWVLVDVSGEPLPATIPLDASYRVVLDGRRLTLHGDGTFDQTGTARIEAGRRAIAHVPDVHGTYECHGSAVALSAAGGDTIVATRRGTSLRYVDGGRSWLYQRCGETIVVSGCTHCHREVDLSDPSAPSTFRFASLCNGAVSRP
ncbi:MAG TPA: hypothetical protein VEA99_15410 [Gemmatimonadaceae bacterium]|nr:hypothetical protein [Gemmatimonadaceae bacterium]